MNQEEISMLQGLFQGANLQHAQINVVVQNGAKVVYKEVTNTEKRQEPAPVTDTQVADAIVKSQPLFWAQSAWAVVYCVCRDHLGMAENMTEFERYIKSLPFTQKLSYECPEGTIQSTLKNNPYMRYPISKWAENGAKERALLLVENLTHALTQQEETF